MKISDTKVQSKISIEKFEYSNDIFKRFFKRYKKNLKIENNNITFYYDNGDYNVTGKSKLNINGCIWILAMS